MNQQAYAELTKMLNGFPQNSGNLKALLLTYDEDLTGVLDQAIIEAAQRYRRNEVAGQSTTFAPSIAEFVTEARKMAEVIPLRNRPRLPSPKEYSWAPQPKEHRVRMGFRMSLLSMGLTRKEVEKVAAANEAGLEEMMALAQTWGVPISEELWAERGKAA